METERRGGGKMEVESTGKTERLILEVGSL